MQLYHTKVVPCSEDSLWKIPAGLPPLTGAKLLVVSARYHAAGPEEQTLLKMMAACKLPASAFAVIQLSDSERISWQMLAAVGAPRTILMLGITPAQLAISAMFRLNHCNSFLGCTFIPSHTLAQIEQNAAMKRELWEQGLKPCFSL